MKYSQTCLWWEDCRDWATSWIFIWWNNWHVWVRAWTDLFFYFISFHSYRSWISFVIRADTRTWWLDGTHNTLIEPKNSILSLLHGDTLMSKCWGVNQIWRLWLRVIDMSPGFYVIICLWSSWYCRVRGYSVGDVLPWSAKWVFGGAILLLSKITRAGLLFEFFQEFWDVLFGRSCWGGLLLKALAILDVWNVSTKGSQMIRVISCVILNTSFSWRLLINRPDDPIGSFVLICRESWLH